MNNTPSPIASPCHKAVLPPTHHPHRPVPRIPRVSYHREQQPVCEMDEQDSDPEYSDFDFSSPLSSSQILVSRKQSSQRLYSQHPPGHACMGEHSPLLGGHAEDVFGEGYGAAGLSTGSHVPGRPSGSVSEGAKRLLTRKISRVFQSKAYDYDANKSSLAAVGSGERVWYGSPPKHEDCARGRCPGMVTEQR